MNASKLLSVVVVLQLVILAGQWLGTPQALPSAQAQVPDAGAIRLQILDETKTLNGKMDKLIGVLTSGDVQVKVVTPDENKKR
jgi:hypothetical protein